MATAGTKHTTTGSTLARHPSENAKSTTLHIKYKKKHIVSRVWFMDFLNKSTVKYFLLYGEVNYTGKNRLI